MVAIGVSAKDCGNGFCIICSRCRKLFHVLSGGSLLEADFQKGIKFCPFCGCCLLKAPPHIRDNGVAHQHKEVVG